MGALSPQGGALPPGRGEGGPAAGAEAGAAQPVTQPVPRPLGKPAGEPVRGAAGERVEAVAAQQDQQGRQGRHVLRVRSLVLFEVEVRAGSTRQALALAHAADLEDLRTAAYLVAIQRVAASYQAKGL